MGPRSPREMERGVSETGGFAPYEKRFLCGVEGVRVVPVSMEVELAALTGGVCALEPERSFKT